jgi:hypothetical protein
MALWVGGVDPCQHVRALTDPTLAVAPMIRAPHLPRFTGMELLLMILIPLPLGLLVRSRMAAFVAYIAIHSFVFTFQTASLILEWINGSTHAFGPYPEFSNEDVWGYGIVNLVIYAVGLGLVALGHRIRSRRGTQPGSVELDPASAR